jgi:Translation initiation factor eIF3 subunit 135
MPPDYFIPDKQSETEEEALDLEKRLRPEFLRLYQSSLCSDALTPTSGATRSEREANDSQLIRSCRFLRESWIPGFIKSLDTLDIRPFDSRSMTVEMHRNGINMRYLGIKCLS